MSFYFREKPRFGDDKNREKTDDELFEDLKQRFDNNKTFFDRSKKLRDPFDRHTSGFSRGFPFDDEGFGRRSDIRSHLDDLAARHPEFADHLLGPAWGDAPFTGSLRNRRRGSSNNTNNHHHHQSNNQDEDTRSQASGSSATSAASGASGVSSHGEPEQLYQQQQQQQQQEQEPTTSSSSTTTNNNKIPQYGLRNTVDIGQHRHNIMNQDRDNRGQRSMSAPPENRQGTDEQQIPNQNIQNNPRFVSRVDITPQINPLTGEKINQSPPQPQPHHQQQQQQQQQPPSSSQQQQSNVRHIPIFVEGRDTPVVPKNIDEPIYHHQHQPSPPPRYHRDTTQFDIPPEFHSPPHFQRPSHFNQHYVNKHNPWSGFQDQFSRDPFDHPGLRRTTQQTNPSPPPTTTPSSAGYRQNKFNNNNINDNFNKTKKNTTKQSQHDDVDNATVTEPQIRKQTVPIDALEKVSLVQNEVDSLTEQVKLWNGNTRKDKQYIYLDEMLTRELIKLDDIDTEGKENVRQARKNAIKSIQDSISLLESKAPIGDQINNNKIIEQQQQQQPMDIQAPEVEKVQVDSVEKMEIEKKSEDEVIANKAIPLPPGPTSSSPVQSTSDNQINLQNKIDDKIIVDSNIAIPLEAAPVAPAIKMDVQSNELTQINDNKINEKNKNNNDDKKTLKKMKKIKKQTPISSEPIPLPAPEIHQTLK